MENNEEAISQVDKKKFVRNVGVVLFSNILSVIAGVLVGFIIPKIMGVEDHGYYKAFTLYASYIGMFHFGFIDGIHLRFAGKKYNELDKEKFRAYSRFLIILQLFVSIIFTGIAMFFVGNEYSIIFLLIAIDVLAVNISTYFEFISQVTMRFKQLSLRNTIKSASTIVSVIILFLLNRYCKIKIVYYIYVMVVVIINYTLALWYLISYRDIVFGRAEKIKNVKSDIFSFFKIGIPLLLSNLVVQFIFLVDQQAVNIGFENEIYSKYAFAYNMISLITIATGAISTVLYPTLKSISKETIKEKYGKINSLLLVLVALSLLVYFPLVPFINTFLSDYSDSLRTFSIILPGVMISSSISVIKYNCYKTFDHIKEYFIISLFVLVLAIVADVSMYYIFKTTDSISIVSIIVLLVWYVTEEVVFYKKYGTKWVKNALFMVTCITIFYLSQLFNNVIIGAVVYFAAVCIAIFCYYFLEIREMIKNRKDKKNG